jgi:surface antigen
VAFNAVLLIAVLLFVLNANSVHTNSQGVLTSTDSTEAPTNPLDHLSSADIAVTAARMTGLPELTAVTNDAQSQAAGLTQASSNDITVSKPQVVATTFASNKDIQSYVVQAGDSISSIAKKFGITSDSVRWSNNITGEAVSAGQTLLIPPVSGIVYTVKAGDTPDTLANKYKASKAQIIASNDAEISGLQVGERIIIPNGQQPAPVYTYTSYYSGFAWGTSAIYGFNGYDYGFCTWYVANRRAELGRPVPSNLGDAYTWYTVARNAGLSTGTAPRPGAVMVNQPGDHVAVVEQVNGDGSFWVSEMNSYGQVGITNPTPTGGWGRVDFKLEPAGSASRYYYIY